MRTTSPGKAAAEIFYAALSAVDPWKASMDHAEQIRCLPRSGNFQRLLVIGFGKAACAMAGALETAFAGDPMDGIVITKYGHCEGRAYAKPEHVKTVEAGHPVPDEEGLKATEEIIRLLAAADEKTLVVCLISGGASALFVSPCEGITLADKQQITELLLKAGADIHELNTVRKHISRVKGGRLAQIAWPAAIVSLILSDVMGDRIDVIASGPTAPDKTTFHDALEVLGKYGLLTTAPKRVIQVLRDGSEGLIPETPKEGDAIFGHVKNIIIGSNEIALAAAKRKAEEMGFHAEILSSGLSGEAREAGRWLARRAKDALADHCAPVCLISGGETTVRVKGNGKGGRNMEVALAFAMETEGFDGITLLSAGTDGTDGPTDAAGALVNGDTIRNARTAGLDPDEYLNNNDSYSFFEKAGGLFVTGPTGTNVMDIQIVMIE